MQERATKRATVLSAILWLVTGVCIGIAILFTSDLDRLLDESLGSFAIGYGLYMLMVVLVLFLQVIIHETGHLVFGLASGYRFFSFRIFGLVLMKKGGKLVLRREKVPGTGGQCLMGPPEYNEGNYPYLLYNLGGCLMNLIASALFLAAYLLAKDVPLLNTLLLTLTICGVAYALLNGIPMQTGNVPNDGYNALHTDDSPESRRSFWNQLKMSEYSAEGIRVTDMPDELFLQPPWGDRSNAIVGSSAVFYENRLMAGGRYEEANDLCHELLDRENGFNMPGIHRNVILCDRITTDILLDNGKCTGEELRSKEMKDTLKRLQDSPIALRTKYVISLFLGEDEKTRAGYLDKFRKIAASYPGEAEIAVEEEILSFARKRFGAAQ